MTKSPPPFCIREPGNKGTKLIKFYFLLPLPIPSRRFTSSAWTPSTLEWELASSPGTRTLKFLHEDHLNSASLTSPRRHQSASVASSQSGRPCLNLSCRAGRRKGDRLHAQNASSCRLKTVYNYMCRKETLTVHTVLNAHQFLDRITMTLINCPVCLFFFYWKFGSICSLQIVQ